MLTRPPTVANTTAHDIPQPLTRAVPPRTVPESCVPTEHKSEHNHIGTSAPEVSPNRNISDSVGILASEDSAKNLPNTSNHTSIGNRDRLSCDSASPKFVEEKPIEPTFAEVMMQDDNFAFTPVEASSGQPSFRDTTEEEMPTLASYLIEKERDGIARYVTSNSRPPNLIAQNHRYPNDLSRYGSGYGQRYGRGQEIVRSSDRSSDRSRYRGSGRDNRRDKEMGRDRARNERNRGHSSRWSRV